MLGGYYAHFSYQPDLIPQFAFFFFLVGGGYIESIIFLGRSKFKTFVDDITYDISIGVLASTSLFFLEPEVAFYGLFTVQVHCTDMAN